jgi:hypothetical protein
MIVSGIGDQSLALSSSYDSCCPLVVDPLCLVAILLGIAGATYFLQFVIANELAAAGGGGAAEA